MSLDAASRAGGKSASTLASPTCNTRRAASASAAKISSCSRHAATSASTSRAVGVRPVTSRNANPTRAAGASPASRSTRAPTNRAASSSCGSLSSASACSGVLVAWRFTVHTARSVASKVIIAGGGTVRFQNV